MATTATATSTYLSTFPPPPSNIIRLSSSPSTSLPQSIYTPPPDSFPLFSLLPFELQNQIWTEAAQEWITEYLERVNTWTVNCRRVFLVHITSNARYRRQSPNLLWGSAASRSVMYHQLLHAKLGRSKERISKGGDVQLFLRRCAAAASLVLFPNPRVYGVRVQEFGEGLEARVGEEKERGMWMEGELEVMRRGEIVDEGRSPGDYVRLPLLNGGRSGYVGGMERGRRSWVPLYPVVVMESR